MLYPEAQLQKAVGVDLNPGAESQVLTWMGPGGRTHNPYSSVSLPLPSPAPAQSHLCVQDSPLGCLPS